MQSSKLKNIAILILIITNVCLLLFSGQRDYQADHLQGKALKDAVELVTKNGLLVSEDQIPDTSQLLPQTAPRTPEMEARLAGQLLGTDIREEATGAEVYRYSNSHGFLQFHNNGAFFGEFPSGVFLIGDNPEGNCRSVLSQLELEVELLSEEDHTYTYRQIWNGVPLYSQQITMETDDTSILTLNARQQLVVEGTPDPGRETISSATALITFYNGVNGLGDVCSRVDEVTPGYVGTVSLNGPMVLTPVWYIATDTGSYQLDLVTGDLTRSIPEGSVLPEG